MPECRVCKNEKKELETIPYIVHKSEMLRSEMREKRILGVMLALAASFVISNAIWIIALVK